jgi:hypothetical protein
MNGAGVAIDISRPPATSARQVAAPRNSACVDCARPAISSSTMSGYSAR